MENCAFFLLFKIWKKPTKNCLSFQSALTFYVLIQQAAKIKPNFKKTRKFHKFVGRPAAANFGRETFTGNRKDTNWPLTNPVKFPCLLLFLNCYALLLSPNNATLSGPYQENFCCNNKTNYTRRHKFITHKIKAAARSSQVAVMTSHCS